MFFSKKIFHEVPKGTVLNTSPGAPWLPPPLLKWGGGRARPNH